MTLQTTEEDDPPLVEVTGPITTNTIWRKDTWYKVVGDVEVTALLVIEPGTTIFLQGTQWSAFDPRYNSSGVGFPASDGGLVVRNGGAVIAMGTPSEPICFEAYDDPNPEENPRPGYYHAAIRFESTASTASKISFCDVYLAYAGFRTDNIRLETPIQNCRFSNCIYGIRETGTQLTDIFNNLIYYSLVDSIDVDLKASDGSEDSETEIAIQSNTYMESVQNNITVHGVTIAGNAGTVRIFNNLMTNSYKGYGLCLCDGYMKYLVACNGYYRHPYYRSRGYDYTNGVIEVGAVVSEEFPYDYRPLEQGLLALYLDPTSSFVDAGCGGVELVEGVDEEGNPAEYLVALPGSITAVPPLVGATTQFTRDCDEGAIDLGYHYSNFNRSNAGQSSLPADLNTDGVVNQDDETILRTHLGNLGSAAEGDLNGDGFVDLYDLRILRSQKGKIGCVHPNLAVSVAGDVNNLSNLFDVSGVNEGDTDVFLFFLDGCYLSQLFKSENDPHPKLPISSFIYKNGAHSVKVIGVDQNGKVTLSSTVNLNFDNAVDCLTCSPYFSENKNYTILGFNQSSDNFILKFEAIGGNPDSPAFQTSVSGDNICVSVPASIFVENYYDLVLDKQTEQESGDQTLLTTADVSDSTPYKWPIIRPISEWGPSALLLVI